MSFPRHISPVRLLAPLAAFAAALALFFALDGSSAEPLGAASSAGGGFGSGARSPEARIAALEDALRRGPRTADRYATLGAAYLEQAGSESGRASAYTRAERALETALALDRRSAAALSGLAQLRLAQHDFAAGLRLARRAHRMAPGVVRIYGPMVDGLVELGRYDEAERTLQRMIDLKPNLASYARASYLRELHGDLRGASEAMRLAVAAGGGSAENAAYAYVLLGNLETEQGRLGAARRAYGTALSRYAGYPPAIEGMARLDWARGDLNAAVDRLARLFEEYPQADHGVALAETERAAGRRVDAAAHLAQATALHRRQGPAGFNPGPELAVFEADHGSSTRALRMARRIYAAGPSVQSADALGWALTRAGRPAEGLRWAREALKLGSRDRLFLYHAGMAARGAGETALAKRWLSQAVRGQPAFSPLPAQRAQRALEELT